MPTCQKTVPFGWMQNETYNSSKLIISRGLNRMTRDFPNLPIRLSSRAGYLGFPPVFELPSVRIQATLALPW